MSGKTSLEILNGTEAVAVGVRRADEVSEAVGERRFLHAGPPLNGEPPVGPMRGAVVGALVLDGAASSIAEAEAMADEVDLSPCHDAGAVGAMAGVISASMPVVVVEGGGYRAFAPLNEGLGQALRFGSNDPETIARLRWMRDLAAPMLDHALKAEGGIDVRALQGEALRRGDECHNRNVAATAALAARLATTLVESDFERSDVGDLMRYVSGNPHFFLSFSIAAGKVIVQALEASEDAGVVTAVAGNGREMGIRVSGLPGRWFTAPAPVGQPKLFEGYTLDDVCPMMGDSYVTECVGLGAFAASAAPALTSFVGGDPLQIGEQTDRMREITRGESSRYLVPFEGFRGTPIGIDVARILASGFGPVVNNGLAHREAGRGQVGAGISELPVAPFEAANAALEAAGASA
ncbi:MAG TPA: DUF1116 domain-containing protein [Solirubrobacterales bacterium]|nr:DUF1116 domain-containing protein [Solirubrobacterales bacterium]